MTFRPLGSAGYTHEPFTGMAVVNPNYAEEMLAGITINNKITIGAFKIFYNQAAVTL